MTDTPHTPVQGDEATREAVAKALNQCLWDEGRSMGHWDELSDTAKNVHRRRARAALTAMQPLLDAARAEGFAAGQASALEGLAQEVQASVADSTDWYTGEIAESHVASAIKRRMKAQEASDQDHYDTDTGYEGHEFYEEPWKV